MTVQNLKASSVTSTATYTSVKIYGKGWSCNYQSKFISCNCSCCPFITFVTIWTLDSSLSFFGVSAISSSSPLGNSTVHSPSSFGVSPCFASSVFGVSSHWSRVSVSLASMQSSALFCFPWEEPMLTGHSPGKSVRATRATRNGTSASIASFIFSVTTNFILLSCAKI